MLIIVMRRTMVESSDDEVFINRNCVVVLSMILKDMRKYIDMDLTE